VTYQIIIGVIPPRQRRIQQLVADVVIRKQKCRMRYSIYRSLRVKMCADKMRCIMSVTVVFSFFCLISPTIHASSTVESSDVTTRVISGQKCRYLLQSILNNTWNHTPSAEWHRNEFETTRGRGTTGRHTSVAKRRYFFRAILLFCWLYKHSSRFGERFRDGQYSLVSFLFAVLLLTVPPRTQPFLKLRGARAPLPHGVGAVDHCLSEILNFLFGCNSSQQECT